MSGFATGRYAELQATSHFSFLRGASSCEDLFDQAALCGVEALAVCDRSSLAGIVRAHEAAKVTGVRAVVGSRLDLACGMALLVYPTDRAAYARLCRLLSLGKARAGKGGCELHWTDVVDRAEGLLAILVPDGADADCAARLRRLVDVFGDRANLALTLRRRPRDPARLLQLSNLAAAARVRTVVTNDVLFATPDRRILQDVVTCIREGCTIDDVGWVGQRTWNGVAILTRDNAPVVTRNRLPGDRVDTQARYLEAAVNGVLVASIYLPNGNPSPGPKFDYKLAWFERLIEHVGSLMAAGAPVVLAGDFNVVPTEADIYQPNSWKGDALVSPEARATFQRLLDQGWTDALRARHPNGPLWTYWSYLRQRWPADKGLRIDHLLLSPDLAARLVDAGVDREVRGQEGASDHAPAWIELDR